MSGSRLRPYLLPVVAALVVLAVGVGSAIAAIPNNGTYYACLTKSTGAIKVINYPRVKCAKGQTLIKWSQQGPAGAVGAQGPQGPAGPADWNAIANKPADFADGVDNAGVTGVKLTRVVASAGIAEAGTELHARCPAGSKVTGGGFSSTYSPAGFRVTQSMPSAGLDEWVFEGWNTSSELVTVTAYAICMSVEPGGAFTTAKKGKVPASVKKATKNRSR
jgi:hypothetical protein